MERYKYLYLWMIIPFLVVQIGIFNFYWPTFATEKWVIHIHYWSVSLWYLLVILQPYLAVNGKIPSHRTVGIFGFLLAGGVIFSSLSLLDIPLKLAAAHVPGRRGPPASFYFGTLVVEFFLMVAFAYAITKSILHRKNLKEHSWWLVCSVFFLMTPALGRGMIYLWRSLLPPENFNLAVVSLSTNFVYLTLFFLFAYKFGKIKHQATIIVVSLVILGRLRFPIGSSETVQEFLKAIIKW